jgi:hypothetical protein
MQISDPAVVRSLRVHRSPDSDITGHQEIDRHTGRTAHHDRPSVVEADTQKRPETMWFPAVKSAPESLTSNRVAADSVSTLAVGLPRGWVRGRLGVPVPDRSRRTFGAATTR